MKQTLLIAVFCILALALIAQTENPFNVYMDAPDAGKFSAALTYLDAQILSSETPARLKAYKLLLINTESNRIIDELLASMDNLQAGESFSVANIFLQMEKYDQATAIYESLNQSYPDWSCPWRHKGEAYYKMGEYEEAMMALTKAIETNENHYDAYVWMAFTLNELGYYAMALEHLEKALKLSPEEEGHGDEEIPQEAIDALHIELLNRAQEGD